MGRAVLATQTSAEARPQAVIRSGRLPLVAPKPTPGPASSDQSDPWLHNDPWRQAKLPSQQEGPEVRLLPESVDTRLNQHATKLQSLEKDLQAFREEQKAARQEDRAVFAKDLATVQGQMATMAKDVSDQLAASVQVLQEAQSKQQQQMQSSLDELKQWFMQSKSPPRKARKDDEPAL